MDQQTTALRAGQSPMEWGMNELEMKHMEKLYSIRELYHDNLEKQVTQIKKRLKSDLIDYTRELLTRNLRDLEKEFNGYNLDNFLTQKVKNICCVLIISRLRMNWP